MEKIYFTKNYSKSLLWMSALMIVGFVALLIFDKRDSFYVFIPLILGASYLLQFFLRRSSYLGFNKNEIVFGNFIRKKKIAFSEIKEQKVLITGDLEIKHSNKETIISKDLFDEEAFKELQQKIVQKVA